MTETAFLLACLCILLGVSAWAYRGEFLTTTEQYNKLLKDYEESTRKNREQREMLTASERDAWAAYKRAFLISLDTDKARIASEEHVKQLRAELDETKARLEAAERAEADTEIYTEERAAEEGGTVSAEGGPGSVETHPNVGERGDTGVMLGVPT